MNIAGANAVMGPRLTRAEPSGLRLRIISALALAPLPVVAIWFGGVWLALLTGVAAAVMVWEWGRLCRGGRAAAPDAARSEVVIIGAVLAAVAIAAVGAAGLAIAATFAGAAIAFWTARRGPDMKPGWTALGTLWVALPCISLLWLARQELGGRATLLWLLVVVWATDIGAFAIGRSLGGPRLAPRWSPRKTWAGLIGGTICAGLAGGATALTLGIPSAAPPDTA